MARSNAARRSEVNERQLKDEAHALVCRGKLAAALQLYGRLLKAQPRDAVLRLRHAELCRKLGRLDDAVEAYLVAGRLLERDGHLNRARAAVTCALQLAPGEPMVMAPLRRLNDKLRAEPPRTPPAHLTLLRQNDAQRSAVPRAARARFGSEAARASREPALGNGASDGEPAGDERVGEVTFRPRLGANQFDGAFRS